jgi:hypothetical protein
VKGSEQAHTLGGRKDNWDTAKVNTYTTSSKLLMLFLSAIVSTVDNASTLSSEAITDSIASDANYGYMGME